MRSWGLGGLAFGDDVVNAFCEHFSQAERRRP